MPLRPPRPRALVLLLVAAAALACGDDGGPAASAPAGRAIARTEGTPVPGAPEWSWVPFPDAFCTDAIPDDLGRYRYGRSTTGLAISWGPETSDELVVFLQGGGACWDFFTCGGAAPLLDKTASAGPFGPEELAREVERYPASWLRRGNLPPSLRDATVVFVPYCTGDVHGGDRVTTYESALPGTPSVTWHHVGHANMVAFLARLVATFPAPSRLVVAGASGGGFGALANYPAIRERWPGARAYLVDDSGPPLVGDAIPGSTRAAWFSRWNLGASLDGFCPACRDDMSAALREIVRRHPADRVALVSHLHDEVIRAFFGGIVLTPRPALVPKPAAEFEADLRFLGTTVMAPSASARYFFAAGDRHPSLDDPGAVATPPPGLAAWLELMLTDAAGWTSASD
jgi:hypothetical protein